MNTEVIIYIEPGNRMHLMACRWNGEVVGKWFFMPYKAERYAENCRGWQQWPKLAGYDLTLAEQQERRDRMCNGCRYLIGTGPAFECRAFGWMVLAIYDVRNVRVPTPTQCNHGKYLPRNE